MSDGCASASDAVGQAMELLRSGRPGAPDAMIVVGADAHVRWETLLGMELLGVISTRDPAADGWNPAEISRPFDARRDGFVLGEGAWAAVLETPEHAAARGAADRAVATLDGYGVTCDAYHRVRPDPAMTESVRAMRHGLADASADASDIDVLHYHGTATPMNDIVETHAVRCAFGDHADRLRGHSVKALIGHPQGASGLASLVATLAGLRAADGWQDSTPATDAAPGPASGAAEPFNVPTVNLDDPGDGCDLDYTPHAPAPARGDERFMINCLAFGAKNSVLVGRAGPPA
jgi:3-oxoacyl-[acyl-carrier-protein] synthase II